MKFQKKVLANGLTVLFEKRDVDVTTVMLGVRYGSAYDPVEEKGIAHFIEHLCFKGTEKRTAKEIIDELEKIGGDVNALTSNDVTLYHVKLPSSHLEVAMDVVFDIFFNPIFPEDDVKREAGVICEEIKTFKDNPMRHSLEKIGEQLYEEPFSISGAGRAEVVRSMTREQLLKKHEEVYVPKNSILCVVGNNNFDEVVAMAEKLSVGKENNDIELKMPEIVLKNTRDSEERPSLEQSNVVLGVHFPKVNDKDYYAADVFSVVLGQGMSSKLFTEIREKRGLVYGVKSFFDAGRDYGYMVIWAGTDPSKAEEVEKLCLEEFFKMKNLTEKELEEAKVQIVGNRKVESEGSEETALNLIMEEVKGKAEDYYEYEKKVGAVSLEDVRALAEKTDFAFFRLGPSKD